MIRTVGIVERNIIDEKLPALALGDGDAATAFEDSRSTPVDEIYYMEIYNKGPGKLYYAYGRDCDNLINWNGILTEDRALSVNTRERVSVYADGATTFARTLFKRNDLGVHGGVKPL